MIKYIIANFIVVQHVNFKFGIALQCPVFAARRGIQPSSTSSVFDCSKTSRDVDQCPLNFVVVVVIYRCIYLYYYYSSQLNSDKNA